MKNYGKKGRKVSAKVGRAGANTKSNSNAKGKSNDAGTTVAGALSAGEQGAKLLSAQVRSMNREEWLTRIAEQVAPLFPDGLKARPFRVTCGWPSVNGLGVRSRRVGECHSLENSKDKVHEIFISPVLDDPLEVAGTLAHELAHVSAGVKAAHSKEFVLVCKHIGLTAGKPKNIMPGPLLNEFLTSLLKKLPVYPHRAIVPTLKTKKANGGPLTLVCAEPACGCRVTMARRWLGVVPDLPTCGCGQPFEVREKE